MFRHEGDNTLRIETLSDGIFAIVLTLLVLELKLPESDTVGHSALVAHLMTLWPRLWGFLLTFLVTGVYWVAHHGDFILIERYNRSLLWLNLMFLLCVTLLPFTTALLGNNGSQALVWNLYATNVILIGVMLTATWGYAVTHSLTKEALDRRLVQYLLWRHLITPTVFVLSMVATLISTNIAFYLPLLIPLLLALLNWVYGRGEPQPLAQEGRGQAWLWRLIVWLPILVFALWAGLLLLLFR